MFACMCGKAFKHRSSLSRHKYGNSKEKGCATFLASIAKNRHEDNDEIQRLLKSMEKLQEHHLKPVPKEKIALEDYNSHTPPSWVIAYPSILREIFSSENTFAPVTYLKRIHFCSNHPESWNVVWPNLKENRIMYYQDSEWCHQHFDSWVERYLYGVLHICKSYLPSFEKEVEHLAMSRILNKTDMNRWKRDLKNVIIGPMRKTIRTAHGL